MLELGGIHVPETDESVVAKLILGRSVYEPNEFDVYIQNLRNGDEIAVVARLMALAEKKPKGERPGVAFCMRVMWLRDTSLYVLDTETGVRSIDGDSWYELVARTAKKVMRGRSLSSKRAAELAAKSHKDRERVLVDEWMSSARAEDRQRVGQHWRNPAIRNAAEAIAKVPEEFA